MSQSIPKLSTQGMVSPATPFVDIDNTLRPVAFRFLFSILQAVAQLQDEVTTLESQVVTLQNRLTAGGL